VLGVFGDKHREKERKNGVDVVLVMKGSSSKLYESSKVGEPKDE